MIFIGGASSKQERLDFRQSVLCPQCGRYGSLEVYMEYMCFSVFFIPVAKWNKKFFVRSTCCGSLYSISDELGSRILRGENVVLSEQDLHLAHGGAFIPRCPRCGYEIQGDYRFCPNCGNPLK